MNKYILSCGSTVDLTLEHLNERNIDWLPFLYYIDDVEYEDDLDPKDNYILEIHSEKGLVISSADIELILKPRIYKNGIDITEKMDMKYFKWVRTSSDPKADAEWNLRHATGIKDLYITHEDVKIRAVFHCAFLTGAAEVNFVTNMYAAYMSSINNKGE